MRQGSHPLPTGVLVALLTLSALPAPAAVRGSIAIDLDSGRVLESHGAGTVNAPASLAKIMTLYLLLEAEQSGALDMDTRITTSARAAAQPATRLGLRTGDRIAVRTAAEALLVRSANDVAVAVAEHLAGDEAGFTARMNARATGLGLRHTRFANASGLPGRAARTTARDMAVLGTALYRRFARHAALFATTRTRFGARTVESHNGLLKSYPGALGLKTGFTCRAGYNAVTVAARGARRVLGVVLGAATSGERNTHARALLDRAFDAGPRPGAPVLARFQPAPGALNTTDAAARCHPGHAAPVRHAHHRPRRWSVELEPFTSYAGALARAHRVGRGVRGARPLLLPFQARALAYRAGVTNLDRDTATALCRRLRADTDFCVVRPPAAHAALRQRVRTVLEGGR